MATSLPAATIFDAALRLPEDDRLDLASRLIASVEDPADEGCDEAWLAELDRREAAARGGAAVGSDWSEVRARLRTRFTAR